MKPSYVVVLSALAVGVARAGDQTYWPDIGYTALQTQLEAAGKTPPNGAGISVWQVEGMYPKTVDGVTTYSYKVDTGNAEFNNNGPLHNITNMDNLGTGTSGHATVVGQYFYGNTSSIAKGIGTGTNAVFVSEANSWLSSFLNTESDWEPAALPGPVRIINNSWAARWPSPVYQEDIDYCIDALRRLDYVIVRDNVIVTAGADNGATSQFPMLLGNAYNAISVGLTSGNSSKSVPTLDAPGRSKIDIVAPLPIASYATPVVSAAAALLLQTGDSDNARQATTVKAILMAGATKNELASWSQVDSNSQWHPLDLRFGAGELNIQRSYNILVAGEQEAGGAALVSRIGWDYDAITKGSTRRYFFEMPAGLTDSLSILLTWNRLIGFTPSDGSSAPEFDPYLANLNLKLYAADDFALGTLLEESLSTVDNVEHIYRATLAGGRYAFEISMPDDASNADFSSMSYAIAWMAVPEPATLAFLAIGLGTFWPAWRRARRRRADAEKP